MIKLKFIIIQIIVKNESFRHNLPSTSARVAIFPYVCV